MFLLAGIGLMGPLAERQAWSGDLAEWHTVEVDFSELEGWPSFFLRWRFATDDLPGTGVGWFIDNVVLEAPVLYCAPPHRRNVPGAYCRGHLGEPGWPVPLCSRQPRDSGGRRADPADPAPQ